MIIVSLDCLPVAIEITLSHAVELPILYMRYMLYLIFVI
jgi:hypothetical protein